MMKLFLQVILTLSVHFAFAQNEWLNYTNNYNVTDIIETNSGLWMSSTGGLCYYDSLTQVTTYFNRGNSNLPSNYIHDIIMTSDSSIWMTTSEGICVFSNGEIKRGPNEISGPMRLNSLGQVVVADRDSLYIQKSAFDFDVFSYSNFAAEIAGIEIDSADNIYINVVNFFAETYIAKWNGVNWETIFSDFIYESSMTMDSKNRIWFLSSLGLKFFSNDIETHVLDIDTLDGFSVGRLFVDASDQVIFEINKESRAVWIYQGSQLVKLNYVKNKSRDCYLIKPSDYATSKYYCINQRFGLYQSDAISTSKYYSFSQSPLPYNNILSVLHSSENHHYIVGYDSIQIIRDGAWTGMKLPDDFTDQLRLAQIDPSDVLYISNGVKIWSYKNGQWIVTTIPREIDDEITFMRIAESGDIWIQSSLNLARLRNGKWEVYKTRHHGLTTSIIKDLKIDSETNEVWVSSFQGIVHFDGSQWTKYSIIPVNNAFGLALANEGAYVRSSGLHYLKDGIIENVTMPPVGYYGPFESNMIFDDKNDVLYLTGSNALAALENDQWTVHTISNSGIYNGYSYDISLDKNDNIWLSGAGGGIGVFNANGIVLSQDDFDGDKGYQWDLKVFPTVNVGNWIAINSGESAKTLISIFDIHGKLLYVTDVKLIGNVTYNLKLPELNTRTILMRLSSDKGQRTVKLINSFKS